MNEYKMKKIWSMLFVFGFMIVMPFSAFATPIIPFVEEANIDIIDPDTGDILRTDNYADILNSLVTFEGDVASFVYGSGVVLTDGDPNDYYKVDFNLAVDPDPWYVWNVNLFNSSTKNLRAHTETFSGIFTEPVGAYTEVSSRIDGMIGDFQSNGVTIEPVNQSKIAVTELYSDSNPSVNMGVDVGDAITIGGGGFAYLYSDSVDPIAGPDPYPDSLWTGFRTTVSFSVTTLDSANFNGRVEIIPTSAPDSSTPEPSTLFLLGAGLVMVSLVVWRRRKRYS
jgi:hypothetical protein